MNARRAVLAAAALAALLLAGGAVYLRLAGPAAALRAAGGREVFREAASVNGLDGTLRVYSMPPAAPDARPVFSRPASGAWCAFVPGGAPGAPAAALLFEARGADAVRAGAPQPWPVSGVPQPDGLEPSFAAALAGGGTAAAAGTAAGSPAAAAAALRAALEAGGWTAASPGADAASAALYRRRGAVALAFAAAREDGSTGWLLLRSDRALP